MHLDLYQSFIHKSRYARYLEEQLRRENWAETVERYCTYMGEKVGLNLFDLGCYDSIYNLQVMPSMRSLMTAGKALERDPIAGFNCCYTAVDELRTFDEAFFILLNGCGVGYSVERQYIQKLPVVADTFYETDSVIHVRDSKLGWAKALKELITLLYQGQIPKWDVSKVRPKGAILKTFGGRASGSGPLVDLFNQVVNVIKNAKGRKLQSIECHDIMCHIASSVVCGGVRRSAMISLSNLSDDRMRGAKSGQWWIENSQRSLANNSACYTEKPDVLMFMNEWKSLYESRSGERGIFNRYACNKMVPERRDIEGYDLGCNPCSEIVLRSKGCCNLSEIVCRHDDSLSSIYEKAKVASILGTCQSSMTDFRYVSKQWQKNAEEEALLGVSLTGIYDCNLIAQATPEVLVALKEHVNKINLQYASKIGINPSVATTCVKPSGTVSQLVNAASGIHPRYNNYYLRRVRNDKKDPLSDYMVSIGVPYNEDPYNSDAWVFDFPMAAPQRAVTRKNISAIQHLEQWKKFAVFYCEHKPSITCSVKEDEWFDVGAWVWKNFDIVSGISFLPSDDDSHSYKSAPYEDITKEKYDELVAKMPTEADWDSIKEEQDDTTGMQEYACSAGGCEL